MIKQYKPMEIEKESFRIISQELEQMGISLPLNYAPIIKRVIHTTADFSYVDSMYFSEECLKNIATALKNGTHIVTDTNMAKSGIHKKSLEKYGNEIYCFMADPEVGEIAKEAQITRASVSMEKSVEIGDNLIYVIGNAPTALLKLVELYERKLINPTLVIGAPVGFVNVVEAKELLIASGMPCIVPRGRKGGSNVAAAILNAILYEMIGRENF